MRTSAVGFHYTNETDVLNAARKFAEVTHNHPEGIKGAQATAFAIFLARQGGSKADIRMAITNMFNYDLTQSIDEIRPKYGFDESCQGSVPQAITAFLESGDFEDAIRNAVSLGGDADTLACITGSIAEAYYGAIPPEIEAEVKKRLPEEFIKIIDKFYLMLEG
jgi:ADP-ribosylglycohydrolase